MSYDNIRSLLDICARAFQHRPDPEDIRALDAELTRENFRALCDEIDAAFARGALAMREAAAALCEKPTPKRGNFGVSVVMPSAKHAALIRAIPVASLKDAGHE